MAYPRLLIDDDPRAAAWDALVAALQRDGDLRRVNPVWRLPADPLYGEAPADNRWTVKLGLELGQPEPITARDADGKQLHQDLPTLRVGLYAPGTLWVNAANVWGAIEGVLTAFPGAGVGVGRVYPGDPPDFARPETADEAGYFWGTFTFDLFYRK